MKSNRFYPQINPIYRDLALIIAIGLSASLILVTIGVMVLSRFQ